MSSMRMYLVSDDLRLTMIGVSICSMEDWERSCGSTSEPLTLEEERRRISYCLLLKTI